MLKQIIFILKSVQSVYMQTIVSDIGYLGEKFREIEVTVSYLTSEEKEDSISSYPKENVLFLTDDAEQLDKMLDDGFYIVALQHDQNNRVDLHRALYAMSEIRDIDFDSFLKAYQRLAGLPWFILETKRLLVRETTVDDVDDFDRIYSEPSITEHMPALVDVETEKVYAADYIKTIYTFYGYGMWTVILKETGEVIGRAGISQRDGFIIPELGFIIAYEHQRKGYAEEVLRAILELAKNILEMEQIQAFIRPENGASIKLCKKLGFSETDIIYLDTIKHLVYSIEL